MRRARLRRGLRFPERRRVPVLAQGAQEADLFVTNTGDFLVTDTADNLVRS